MFLFRFISKNKYTKKRDNISPALPKKMATYN